MLIFKEYNVENNFKAGITRDKSSGKKIITAHITNYPKLSCTLAKPF